ncbi:MAG TPA: hypothetical protein VIW29_14270 [Polyangiaceae bacterium]
MRQFQLFGVAVACAVAGGCGASDDEATGSTSQAIHGAAEPVGLSLRFVNGQAAPLTLLGRFARYPQEIDLSETVASTTDDGIAPLIQSSGFSALDWSGVTQVEELWIPSLDGTLTRERYFRGANWMEQPSQFELVALSASGAAVGQPWVTQAGRDDRLDGGDDTFVRRFVARQSAFGCSSVGNCAGASFVAEGLVQVRDALDPEHEARRVPSNAVALRLTWNRLPGVSYEVSIAQQPTSCTQPSYGFQVSLEPAGAPANGHYYAPGEQVSLRVTFRDGQGTRLHPEGQLPTYGEFVAGQVDSGLRYLDLSLQTRLFYALKHRESNLLAVLSGPTNKLKTPTTVVDPNAFFGPQVPFATTAVDGYTAVGVTVPPAAIIFGGFTDPALWSLPVSDLLNFTIPADAEAGTYVAAIKARRDYAGEALNRGATLELQVGQAQPSAYTPKTACSACHSAQEKTSFSQILHGIGDRRACFGCHASLGIELDNVLDVRVHAIHDRSHRFEPGIEQCSTCHLTPPSGPARGVLP